MKGIMYKGTLAVPGSTLFQLLSEKQTPDQMKKVEAHYNQVSTDYRKRGGRPLDSNLARPFLKTNDPRINRHHPLVGRKVLNVHRQSCDYPIEYRRSYHGTITGVLEGCNALALVLFNCYNEETFMCEADLAFVELWPREGCRVRIECDGRIVANAG